MPMRRCSASTALADASAACSCAVAARSCATLRVVVDVGREGVQLAHLDVCEVVDPRERLLPERRVDRQQRVREVDDGVGATMSS